MVDIKQEVVVEGAGGGGGVELFWPVRGDSEALFLLLLLFLTPSLPSSLKGDLPPPEGLVFLLTLS